MNNEEKILQLLEEMRTDISGINKRLENVETLSQRTAVLLETEYRDKLQLLFDGHELLKEKMDTLAPKSRVETLEDEVDTLKTVVRLLTHDVAELKKAQ